MKNPHFLFSALAFLLFSFSTQAQDLPSSTPEINEAKVFIGPSTGLNSYSGLLGIDVEPVLTNQLSLRLTVGVGPWAFKYGGGVNYFFNTTNQGASLSLGFSIATGSKDQSVDLELETENFGSQDVPVIFDPAATINLLYNYNIRLGKKGKFVVGAGYAIPLKSEPYDVLAYTLTSESKQIMKFLVPGGLLLDLRLAFGI